MRIRLFALLFFLSGTAVAQNYKMLTLRAGGMISKQTTSGGSADLPYLYSTSSLFSYMGGIGLNFPLAGRFSIQPELLYVRKSHQELYSYKSTDEVDQYKIHMNYVEIPVYLKAFFAKNKFKFFVFAGPAVGYGLNGKYKYQYKGDLAIIEPEEGKVIFKEQPQGGGSSGTLYFAPSVFNRMDVSAQGGIAVGVRVGAGMVLVEGRYSLGLVDFIKDEESKYRAGMISIGYGILIGSMSGSR